MDIKKRLACLLFLLVVFTHFRAPLSAATTCGGGGACYPPWGVTLERHCYINNETGGCSAASNICSNFCGEDGIESISCTGQPANGVCYCGNPTVCAPCTLDPESCDPQTPFNPDTCSCQGSPLIINVDGEGIQLTDIQNGVAFNFTGNGRRRMAWTRANSRSGMLVLDRNRDGAINDGSELFGTLTEQPPSDTPNGFKALAMFDDAAHGGNGDGWIDQSDGIYRRLRLWFDTNHDGTSTPDELETLARVGLRRISLRYETTNVVDEHGNSFKYRARVMDRGTGTRWMWDVFLGVEPRTR